MGWLSTLGGVGGAAFGGPMGAAAGGAIGGLLDKKAEQQKQTQYNIGQAEASKYSPWTGMKANYDNRNIGTLAGAAQGGLSGYQLGKGMEGAGWLNNSQPVNAGTGMSAQTPVGGAVAQPMQMQGAPNSWMQQQQLQQMQLNPQYGQYQSSAMGLS